MAIRTYKVSELRSIVKESANEFKPVMGKNVEDLKIVTCHLGQGASICAIKDGKSIELGFEEE